MTKNNYTVDMRASLGQELDYYETKTYKPEFAVAEFVDNSVASYLKDKVFLLTYDPKFKLFIDVIYDEDRKVLTIVDNAGGMDQQTFNDALVLGKKRADTSGLNEFGFGLKTAASWFGKKWSVRSTTFNDESEFHAIVDIKDLLRTGKNEVPITVDKVKKHEHYTRVRIWDLKKTISKSNFKKMTQELSSIYRRFISKGEITITFNGQKLVYDDPECLTTIEDGMEKEWRMPFDDFVLFEGKKYPISGFIGLLKEGSYKLAGFTLIRRNRVIIGGFEKGFKPAEIFGAANSFQSLRLFGEINMDKWPVTQAKDDFDWEMNGLKDAFISKMKEISKKYVNKALTYRAKVTKNPITPVKVQEIADETKRNIEHMSPKVDIKIAKDLPPVVVKEEDGISIPSITYPLTIAGVKYNITVEFICESEGDLIEVTPKATSPTDITVSFNTVFPMFHALRTNSVFVKVLQKFFVALVIAEEQALRNNDDGKKEVEPKVIRENLNIVLTEMTNEGDFDDEQ